MDKNGEKVIKVGYSVKETCSIIALLTGLINNPDALRRGIKPSARIKQCCFKRQVIFINLFNRFYIHLEDFETQRLSVAVIMQLLSLFAFFLHIFFTEIQHWAAHRAEIIADNTIKSF